MCVCLYASTRVCDVCVPVCVQVPAHCPRAGVIYIYIHIYANAAPLPEGWSEHQDSSGNVFFFNTATGASTYEHPLDASFKSYYAKLKSA